MIWEPVKDYEGTYEVSDAGDVRRVATGRILSKCPDADGYYRAHLCLNGVRRNWFVHVLVLRAFVGERPDGMQTRHLNGDKKDNRPCNLAWGTAQENTEDKIKHGTVYVKPGRAVRRSDGQLFDSVKAAAHSVNGIPSHIVSCCKGARTFHKGFKWEYDKTN